MNKKVFALVLVVLLAMTCVFAYKGETKIGIDLGVGSDNAAYDDNKHKVTAIVLGGNVTASVQYGLTESSAIKAEVGFNTYSEGVIYVDDVAVETYDNINLERQPNCVFYIGYVYNLPIGRNDLFEWEFGAGLEGEIGSSFVNNDFNLGLGIGFEETFIFNVTSNLAITATTRTGIRFVNTNNTMSSYLAETNMLSIPVFMTAGVTYSL